LACGWHIPQSTAARSRSSKHEKTKSFQDDQNTTVPGLRIEFPVTTSAAFLFARSHAPHFSVPGIGSWFSHGLVTGAARIEKWTYYLVERMPSQTQWGPLWVEKVFNLLILYVVSKHGGAVKSKMQNHP